MPYYHIKYSKCLSAKTESNIYDFMREQKPLSLNDISCNAIAGISFVYATLFPITLLTIPCLNLITPVFSCVLSFAISLMLLLEFFVFILGNSKTKDIVFYLHPDRF